MICLYFVAEHQGFWGASSPPPLFKVVPPLFETLMPILAYNFNFIKDIKWPIFYNVVVTNVFCQIFIYKIALQNTDFGVI